MIKNILLKCNWILTAIRNIPKLGVSKAEVIKYIFARFTVKEKDLTIMGIKFSHVDKSLWTHIFHIILLQEYSPRGFLLENKNVVIDIGANRGVFVALAARQGAKSILAYEPDKDNYEYLEELVKNNHFYQVKLHQKAVAGENGVIRLYQSSKNTRHTIIGVDVTSGQKLEKYIEVPSISLDCLLQEWESIDLLKIDCEGAEYEIFGTASPESLQKVHRIVMEYHGSRNSSKVQNLLTKLKKSGFYVKVEEISGTPLGMIFATRISMSGD